MYVKFTDLPPTPEERVGIMKKNISKYGIPVDYDRLLEYYAHFKIRGQELGEELKDLIDYRTLADFKESDFKQWVIRNGFTEGLNPTKSGSYSFDKESIDNFLKRGAYGDDVVRVFKKYIEFAKIMKSVSFIPNLLTGTKGMSVVLPSRLNSADGRRIALVKPNVELQNTGRFGFTNPAVQNWPRFMKDLYIAPRGYTLLTADSSQIEPMLTYNFYITDDQIKALIKLYGDAYYAVLHYVTMDEKYIQSGTTDFTPFEITPELKVLRQRLKTYNNGVIYGSTSNRENDPLKDQFIKRIGQHPKRQEWSDNLLRKIRDGQRVFTTLFGTKIDIYNSDKVIRAASPAERELSLLHCAINNPIQGTAGDLCGFGLLKSEKTLMTKAPYSWLTKVIHDEDQWCIYNPELDYVLEDLVDCTTYNIEDKVLIKNEPKIGTVRNDVIEIVKSFEVE